MGVSPRVLEGFRFMGSGRLEEAEQASLDQLRESPEDAHAWRLLGVLRLKQSRPAESREALSRAAHLAPEEAGIHLDLGRAFLAEKDLEAAEVSFREALRLRPDWSAAQFNLGVLLRARRRFLEGAQAFARAARLDARDHAATQACIDCAAESVRSGEFKGIDQTMAGRYEPLSIVFCSPDEERLSRSRSMLERETRGSECEVIGILAPRSLASAYNEAARSARHDRIVFMHDDVEFVSSGAFSALSRALDEVDVVGLAGSERATGPGVMWAGHPGLHGWISYPGTESGFDATTFGLAHGLIRGIRTLDGLLIGARRRCALEVGFDEATFDGFHFYDLDFSIRADRGGYSVAVTTDVLALHASKGSFGDEWKRYRDRFLAKFPELNAPMGAAHWYGARLDSKAQLLAFYALLRTLGEASA